MELKGYVYVHIIKLFVSMLRNNKEVHIKINCKKGEVEQQMLQMAL